MATKAGTANPIQIQKHLKGVDYPAEKSDLIECASQQNAPDDVLEALRDLPEREYGSVKDVARGIGELNHS